MKLPFLCPLLLLTCTITHGQSTDTTVYYLNQSSTGNFNQTNDGISYNINNALKFNVAKKNMVLSTTNSYIYGEQLNQLSNNDFNSLVDISLNKKLSKMYYWGMATFTKSYSLKVDNRVQSGAGISYTLVDRKVLYLNLSDGFLYEYSDLYDLDAYQTTRNSARLKFMISLKSFITLESSNFFQPSITYFEDNIILSNTSLTIKLYEWLSLKGNILYNKISLTNKENVLANIGFAIEKYF